MDWWNFTDVEFLIFFSLMIILLLLALGMVISFIVQKKISLHRNRELTEESNTIGIYVIDFKNNNVLYFSRYSIKEKEKMPLSKFYLRFAENDVDKLKGWLYSICVENRSTDDYLEVDMMSNKNKGSSVYYSILKRIRYNEEKSLLHIESHLMRYTSLKPEKSKDKINYGLVLKDEVKNMIESQKSLSGFTYCVRFFYKNEQLIDQNKIERIVAANLKDVVFGFARSGNSPRQIVSDSPNELFLFDLNINDKERAMRLAADISHELKKYISISGNSETVNFAIGVVENSQYYQDYLAIIKVSQQACIYAQQHGLTNYLYMRASKLAISETGKYSQEISRLLKPHNLRYSYRPLIDTSKAKVIGYFSYIKAPESPFSNYMEMTKYSAKVHRNKEFFAYVSKNVISRYISEMRDFGEVLFVPVSLTDLPFLGEVLNQIPNINRITLSLVFQERDFDEEEMEVEQIKYFLSALQDMNYKLSLDMQDEKLLLDPIIYSLFDTFIIGNAVAKEIKKSRSTRLSIHNLVEQLLRYKRPIIATDVEGWPAIELIINSGIIYLSSETISPSSAMIMPVDRKKLEKLYQIAGPQQ